MNTLRKMAATMGLVLFMVAGWFCFYADPGPVGLVQAMAPLPTHVVTDPPWITRTNAENCFEGCWRIESVVFEDEDEGGGNHNVYVHMRNQDGLWLAGQPFHVAYPDGDDRALTKAPPDVGDIAIWACFSPGEGEVGPYWVYAGDDPTRSDILWGVGLPECIHVNYWVTFRYEEQVPMPPTPTPTPTPCVECRRLYLPIIVQNR
jgi:hypothetical protein